MRRRIGWRSLMFDWFIVSGGGLIGKINNRMVNVEWLVILTKQLAVQASLPPHKNHDDDDNNNETIGKIMTAARKEIEPRL